MGILSNVWNAAKGQLANVVEWATMDDETIFYKWSNSEIKKGSKLIIRPGQDAIFLFQGKIEGIFTEEGEYDIASDIIPFLSTLAGFKFGFDSGLRAEVLFVNTREFTVNWGTQNAINLPVAGLPGGMPIRAFGKFATRVDDYTVLIEKVAGAQGSYTIGDIRGRISAVNDQLLMKWIVKEGKDMFNLQASAYDISAGIKEDLSKELGKIGMTVTDYSIQSVSYPDSVREMQEKAAGNAMVGDLNAYTSIAFADGLQNGTGGGAGASMAQMQMGMMMGQQMVNNMQQQYGQNPYGQAPYGQAPYGQAPYGQAPYGQAPYGQAPYGQPVQPAAPVQAAAEAVKEAVAEAAAPIEEAVAEAAAPIAEAAAEAAAPIEEAVAEAAAPIQEAVEEAAAPAEEIVEEVKAAVLPGYTGPFNFCPNCGTKTEGANFCPNCGTKLR